MFKPNDTVICINARPDAKGYIPPGIKEGSTYTVDGVSICCLTRLSLVETAWLKGGKNSCDKCKQPCFGYYAWRFIKLTGDDVVLDDATPREDELTLPEFIKREVEKIV